jgi:hypothetical protein
VRSGPVAQLVERYHGMVEVVGSNPIGSTVSLPPPMSGAISPPGLPPKPRFRSSCHPEAGHYDGQNHGMSQAQRMSITAGFG